MRTYALRCLAAAVIVLAALACADRAAPTGALAPATRGELALDGTSSLAPAPGLQLLECPSLVAEAAAEAVIDDATGGSVVARGARLRVPPGALRADERLTAVAPPSRYMEVALHAVGFARYDFVKPVTVVIDYSRCDLSALPTGATLRAVYIDPESKAILEDRGGADDRVARTLTFSTEHFSSYAVAY